MRPEPPRSDQSRSDAARADGTAKSDHHDARSAAELTAPLLLDRLIHERMRLGIISALAAHDSLAFGELKQLLAMTDGNLSVHARKLEEAGYIECTKTFDGRTPRTEYRITADGRNALDGYFAHMESLIQAVRSAER